MDQDLFKNLPSEITINILSRLPVRTTVCCKYVCKSWLDLIETDEFVKSHLSKSVPGLAVLELTALSKLYKFYDFEDGLDLENQDLHYNLVTKVNLFYYGSIYGSANGLFLLVDPPYDPNGLYICNPITRDYVVLHCPQESGCLDDKFFFYGIGVSKISSQLKVVVIFNHCTLDEQTGGLLEVSKCECHVYTLGKGLWRRIEPGAPLYYYLGGCYLGNCHNPFVNGNLHWLVLDLVSSPLISCFDLEKELFSTFSPPPLDCGGKFAKLFVSGDCLCLCDSAPDNEIVIWSMKEYGVERSWTKEFVISKKPDFARLADESRYARFGDECYTPVCPIKFFKDGDILMNWSCDFLFHYSCKTKVAEKVDMFKEHRHSDISAALHTPSFLSLKSFEMENVRSF